MSGSGMSMYSRINSLRLKIVVVGSNQITCCASAVAQQPGAGSLGRPAASREVTETGEFIGRVGAIDKVAIVARVPVFLEERFDRRSGGQDRTGHLHGRG
jgi:hypothetical protein